MVCTSVGRRRAFEADQLRTYVPQLVHCTGPYLLVQPFTCHRHSCWPHAMPDRRTLVWSIERQASTAMSVTPCRSRRGMQCRSSSRPRADSCAAHSIRKTKPKNEVSKPCDPAVVPTSASARERGPAIGGVARQPRESPAAVGAGRGDAYRSPAPRLSGAWHAITRTQTHIRTYVRAFLPLGNRCQSTEA